MVSTSHPPTKHSKHPSNMTKLPASYLLPAYRHHCTNVQTLSPRETAWLAEVLVEHERRIRQDPRPRRRLDLDDVTVRFNAEFGSPHRTKRELACAMQPRNENFWAAFFKLYEEMIKREGS